MQLYLLFFERFYGSLRFDLFGLALKLIGVLKIVMAHTKDNIVWLNASHKNSSKKFIRRHNIKINQNNNSLTTQQKK